MTFTGNAGCFKIALQWYWYYNGNVTLWQVLRKYLHLKVYKLFIVQELGRLMTDDSVGMSVRGLYTPFFFQKLQ
jgi:hypothetical protein